MNIKQMSLAVLLTAGMWVGCEAGLDPSGQPAITSGDVEAIQPGNAVGALYSGTWVLNTNVTATNCLALGVGFEGFPPKVGDTDEESVVLIQNGGELTRGVDDLGGVYTFRGSVNSDGSYTYGTVITVSEGPPAIERIELATGRFELAEGSLQASVVGSTIKRRYLGGIVDCSADLQVTSGTRTLAGETE
ncbi:MAG: hypothetical protein ACI9WU_005377 [Myxococcota bacterium]|jgi:hypothetical protein